MTGTTLTMDVRGAGDGTSIVDISGDVTASSEDVLMDAYGRATEGGVRAVILNFGGLEYMNSGGIGLLVTLLVRANRQKQRLLAFGLNDHYRQIFELTQNLDDSRMRSGRNRGADVVARIAVAGEAALIDLNRHLGAGILEDPLRYLARRASSDPFFDPNCGSSAMARSICSAATSGTLAAMPRNSSSTAFGLPVVYGCSGAPVRAATTSASASTSAPAARKLSTFRRSGSSRTLPDRKMRPSVAEK